MAKNSCCWIKTLAVCSCETPVPNLAELVDKFYKSIWGSKIVRLFTKPYKPVAATNRSYYYCDCWVVQKPDGEYQEYYTHYCYNDKEKIDYIESRHLMFFKDGVFMYQYHSGYAYSSVAPSRCYWMDRAEKVAWQNPTNLYLYAELESGAQYRFNNGSLGDEDNG
jgi:hypothetical protein